MLEPSVLLREKKGPRVFLVTPSVEIIIYQSGPKMHNHFGATGGSRCEGRKPYGDSDDRDGESEVIDKMRRLAAQAGTTR
jgi:hypothetical protein